MFRRSIAMLLCICMVLSVMPLSSLAATAEDPTVPADTIAVTEETIGSTEESTQAAEETTASTEPEEIREDAVPASQSSDDDDFLVGDAGSTDNPFEEDEEPAFTGRAEGNVLYISGQGALMRGQKIVSDIPEGVSIDEYVFCEGITEIDSFCFSGSLGIKKVTFPKSLKKIGMKAFYSCMNLRHVYFYGDLPECGIAAFFSCHMNITGYYPWGNETWHKYADLGITGSALGNKIPGITMWQSFGKPEPEHTIDLSVSEHKEDVICGTVQRNWLDVSVGMKPTFVFHNVMLKIKLPEGFSFDLNELVEETDVEVGSISSDKGIRIPKIYPIFLEDTGKTEFSMKVSLTAQHEDGSPYATSEDLVFFRTDTVDNEAVSYTSFSSGNYIFSLDSAAGSGSSYNQETARLCAMMSDMTYDRENMEKFLTEEMGFSNFERQGIALNNDLIHLMGRYYASKKIIQNGQIMNLVYVVCRGTAGIPLFGREWLSNFDTGVGNTHAGFEGAAQRVQTELTEYCKKHEFTRDNTVILVTGHSRAAAAANLVGHWLNKGDGPAKKENVSVYTFATPTVAQSAAGEVAGLSGNENIYNLVYYQDAIRNAPSMKYHGRYGNTKIFGFGFGEKESTSYNDGFGIYTLPEDGANFTRSEIANAILYYTDARTIDMAKIQVVLAQLGLISKLPYGDNNMVDELLGAHSMWTYYQAVVTNAPGTSYDAVREQMVERIFDAYAYLRGGNMENRYCVQTFKCPINLYVTDAQGNQVASIVDKQVTCDDDSLFLYVDGDALNVGMLQEDMEKYTIRVTGYADGTMKHSIQTIGADGIERMQVRKDIPVHQNGSHTVQPDGTIRLSGETDEQLQSAYATYEEETEIEDALNNLSHVHVYGDWIRIQEPTCSEEGKEIRTCSCGEKEETAIPMLEHSYSRILHGYGCDFCEDELTMRFNEDYVVLPKGNTSWLEVTANPEQFGWTVQWISENEQIAAVTGAYGQVTGQNVGTTYITATATRGDLTVTDRCRVDVVETLIFDGIQLASNKATTELYSNKYTELEVLLKLPQNYDSNLTGNAAEIPHYNGFVFWDVRFREEDAAKFFELKPLDDRRLAIVPTDYAINNPREVKGSYKSAVVVKLGEQEYESEVLTLTVKKSMPKLKATVPAFNSFYSGQEQDLVITGGTVTKVEAGVMPEWLTLKGETLSLNEKAPTKSASGKASLKVYTEEWRIPAEISLTVKNTYKAPGVKLSASSVTLAKADSIGAVLKLVPSGKKDTLTSLNVSGITAPEGYSVTDFNRETGEFTLKGSIPGKITLNVSFYGTDKTLPLTLTVKTADVKLKLSKTSITLNKEASDSTQITVTATPADFALNLTDYRLTDAKGNDKKSSGELTVRLNGNKITIATNATTPANATYKLYVSAGGSKEVVLTIKTIEKEPTVTFQAKGNLDLSIPKNEVTITPTFKNYSGGFTYDKVETENYTLVQDGNTITAQIKKSATVGTYTQKLILTLDDGSTLENTVKITVKRTAVKLKLSSTKLTLNHKVRDIGEVAVSCTTKGYDFTKPVWALMDKSGKNPADGELNIQWRDGKLVIATNDSTDFGATYKLLVRATEADSAVTLTISIPAENKSAVTATIKAKGSIDVIRDGSAITLTPAYKNVTAQTVEEAKLVFTKTANKVTTNADELFRYSANTDGTFTITKAEGARIDHTAKYTVELVATVNGQSVTVKPIALSVKQGSAKVTLTTLKGTMFAMDNQSRGEFVISAADATLNGIAKLEIKDAKYVDLFEIFDYEDGTYAIGYKDNKVPAALVGKTVTLNLNVFLEGNETGKANITVKLKLTIIK